MNYIYICIYSIILVGSLLYSWHNILNKKINYKDYKLYVSFICILILSIFNYFVVNKFIRILLITIVFMFFMRYLFKEKIQKCVIIPILYQLIVLISETIIVLLLTLLFKSYYMTIIQSPLCIFITNIFVAMCSVFIVRLKFIHKLYEKILIVTDKIKLTQLVIFCLLAVITLNIFAMNAYYKLEFKYWIFISIILILIFCSITIYSFKTQNSFNKVNDKYNIAIKSLKDYEDMMTKYRITNHENKNLLLTVRAMILNKEKDIPTYIDSIVENKYNDDEKLLFEMNVIPSGGLRATIYSEILKIKEHKISYNLIIDRKIKMVDLVELDTNTIIEVCKIIGVFIDNAIEAVDSLKEKYIEINLFVERNYLNIKVSNTFEGTIDIDKINNPGYTTKGRNRGNGLALVKNIVNNNKIFENINEINNNIFSQILTIKHKKIKSKSNKKSV